MISHEPHHTARRYDNGQGMLRSHPMTPASLRQNSEGREFPPGLVHFALELRRFRPKLGRLEPIQQIGFYAPVALSACGNRRACVTFILRTHRRNVT